MSFALPDKLEKLIAPYQGNASIVVTGFLPGDHKVYSLFGDPADTPDCAPEDLIFEIGSISKVFTALLLALLTEQGKIDPDRPIKDLCDEFSSAPLQLTPLSLATHMSGLPRLHIPIWKAMIQGAGDDPYSEFSRDDLVAWLRVWSSQEPRKKPGHAYSNLAFGLLGEVLALSQSRPFLEMLRDELLGPLGMNETSACLSQQQKKRFARPHDNRGRPVVPWSFKALAGAGALRSSAGDLALFSYRVADALSNPTTTLDRAIGRCAEPLIGLGLRGKKEPVSQCLGWLSMKLDPTTPRMLFHDGGTAGSTSALYICPEKRAALTILANRGVAAGLWSSLKLSWSNPHRLANDVFAKL